MRTGSQAEPGPLGFGMLRAAVIDDTGAVAHAGPAGDVPWWSVTKTVIAAAALRLAEAGALDLDAPLAGPGRSLRRLLRHEAGLADYGQLAAYHADVAAGAAPWSVARMLEAVGRLPPPGIPGERFFYSNVGYLKVRQAVESASGLDLGGALDSLVLRPAGAAGARLATTPADLDQVEMGPDRGYDPGWVYHGLLVGPPEAAARALRAVLWGDLLAPASRTAMADARRLPEHRSDMHPAPSYGLGLMIDARTRDGARGHTGGGPGSWIAVYGKAGRAAAVWTDVGGPAAAERAAFEALDGRMPGSD